MSRELNHYELAIQSYWEQCKVPYVPIDQIKRPCLPLGDVKNFDFLLYPGSACLVLVELKGRTFHGTSLAGKPSFDCWVTLEDVLSLKYWQEVFLAERTGCLAGFVFGYQLERIDVEADGQTVFEFEDRRYVFYWIDLVDYCKEMNQRSPKWKTVCLSREQFRKTAIGLNEFVDSLSPFENQ